MDDILGFSRSKEQHTADVCKVLAAISKAWLHLKLSKCKFYKEEVSFLGNLVLKDGHAICPDKLKAIKEWGVPCTTTELCSFLGTINFLRRFCKDILATVAPLTALCGDANFHGLSTKKAPSIESSPPWPLSLYWHTQTLTRHSLWKRTPQTLQ